MRLSVSAFDAAKNCSQNQQFLRRSFPDRGERSAGIKSNKPSFVPDRESKQVYVGQLPWPVNSRRIHDIRVQQTDFIRPEFMHICLACLGQALNDSVDWQWVRVAVIRHDSDAPVLRDRT